MKILILNYEFPPVGGGGGRISADIGAELAQRGHEVEVLTSHLQGLARKESTRGMTAYRVRCLRRRAESCSVAGMAAFVAGATLPAIYRAHRWKPEVLHVHFAVPTGWVALPTSVLTGIPYVLTVHLGDVPGGAPAQTDRVFRFAKPFTLPIWRHAAAITATTSFVIGLCETAYGMTPTLIRNSVDLSGYSRERVPPKRSVRILWVGRIQRQKNLPGGLLQLAGLEDLDWRLDIVGDGPERSEAEETARQTSISDRVRFHGWLDDDAVRAAMERADILFLPSLTEAAPMVALQALAAGLAIVCSRISGLDGVVEHEVNGLCCSLATPSEFNKSLRRLLTNPSLLERMQLESLQRAERFSLESAVDKYESVLREAAGTQA